MGEARNVHGVVHRGGDGIALAGDERRGDRALVAGHDRADALVDRLAHAVDGGGVAQPKAAVGRGYGRVNAAKREAGGADALEVEVTREVVAAGPQWLEWRREARLELDEAADRRRGALAHRHPHALELLGEARSFHPHDPHDNAIRALTLFARLDEARNVDVPGRRLQHGMGDDGALEGRSRKSGRSGRDRQGERKGHRPPPRNHRGSDRRHDEGSRGPGRRFSVGGEIEDNPEAEGDRKPWH